jgi:hypothetical protein
VQLGSNFALDLALSLADREPPILQCVPFVGLDERSGVQVPPGFRVAFLLLSLRLLLSFRAHGSFLQISGC